MAMHCNQIAAEVMGLRGRIYKPKKRKRVQVITTARCLTGNVGWEEALVQKAADDEAAKLAAEKRARDGEVAREQLEARIRNSTQQIFARTVSKSRRKPELEDIIYALGAECEQRDPILSKKPPGTSHTSTIC
ncbi:hypothetical protein BOTBODRAFT_28653 [Botryobasidium botryosum FD-172 SS1]|uniref:Uncharacterized protein n=1 Tax=Botryobasidium botryosum (strain FD-172 SS1) TaxID=930990 RepID=A0A067MTU9_BOTB1|nr:hypothetical protein BOTBODRAFT_28653 [Botryobasidium botryosum FD-172 SS1]